MDNSNLNIEALIGQRCWHVGFGEQLGGSFTLDFGEKVLRSRILKNPNHSEEYRLYEGTFHLLVWCAWRLALPKELYVSHDSAYELLCRHLSQLENKVVTEVSEDPDYHDLRICFGSTILNVFCDHVDSTCAISSNWELRHKHRLQIVGLGLKVRQIQENV